MIFGAEVKRRLSVDGGNNMPLVLEQFIGIPCISMIIERLILKSAVFAFAGNVFFVMEAWGRDRTTCRLEDKATTEMEV
jgi:hypothetical protein